MLEQELFSLLKQGKQSLGVQSKKFTGALVVESLRRAFEERGIRTSRPNVYLKGLSFEVDLIIPRRGAHVEFEILYSAADVLAVLEIKTSGLFSKEDSSRINSLFRAVQLINPSIFCAYVTLSERQSYKYKATEEKLGFPVYTLAWHYGPDEDRKYESTGDFSRLIGKLASLSQ
jgi:hypothetical protein